MSHYKFKNLRVKREIKATILLTILFISGFVAIWFVNNPNTAMSSEKGTVNDFSPLSTSSSLGETIIGSGDNQTVRVYMENRSSSYDNQGSFNISAPTDHSHLTYGDFNFSFQHNYTTDYIIEDNNALDLDEYQYFDFNTNQSKISEYGKGDFDEDEKIAVTDNEPGTYVKLESEGGTSQKYINITLNGNYTNQEDLTSSLKFNRSKILGFQFNLSLIIGDDSSDADIPDNVDLSILAKNITNGWNEVGSIPIKATESKQFINGTFINQNLNYNSLSNITDVRFLFERSSLDNYYIRLYELDLKAIQGFELPITNQNQTALEFDLKGNDSAVNGIHAWIRTLNTTKADDAKLTFSLYKANGTTTRNDLSTSSLIPNYTELIAQKNVTGYKSDGLAYFDLPDTSNLQLYNYFVVIQSNISESIYSLVSIPDSGSYGDDDAEHILKKSIDGGNTWISSNININGYESDPLDASGFKINVTRGYMPSDFETDGFNNITIDKIPLEDRIIQNNDRSDEKWGLGQWTNNFSNYIESDVFSNFQVPLSWDRSITRSFMFNVTSYFARAYSAENATSTYYMDYDGNPEWRLNYSFNWGNPIFTNWNFTEFWFTYENYHSANELINPDFNTISNWEETNVEDNPTLKKIVISNSSINLIDGEYSLKLSSFNALWEIKSYIQYKNYQWKSQGFMLGDNMTIGADIQGPGTVAPTDGTINATLFKPDGSPLKKDIDFSGTRSEDKSILSYNFGGQRFLQINRSSIPKYGTYTLGMCWENGTMAGCDRVDIYIDHYEITLGNITYLSKSNRNRLKLENIEKVGDSSREPYDLYLASVNKTNQFPTNYYSINNSELSRQFQYGDDYKINVNMESFLQNETILNPSEAISFKVSMENLDPNFDINAKVSVKLVSAENKKWTLNTSDSATKTLKQEGDPNGNNKKDFDVSFDIPSINEYGAWSGLNAPIRNGGVKAIATVYLGGKAVGTYECPDYGLLVNKSQEEFEGSIISLQISEQSEAIADFKEFKRESFIYSPHKTHILANIVDKYSVSSYNVFNRSYLLKMRSQFKNIATIPETPNQGTPFNISSTLSTEFGTILDNKSVTLQYSNGTDWFNITSTPIKTDDNGESSIQINPKDITVQENRATLRLLWDGSDNILNTSNSFNISFATYSNQISINAEIIGTDVYKYSDAYLKVLLKNTGNSRLNITDLSLDFDNVNPYYELVQKDSLVLENFAPGESTSVKFRIAIQDIANDELTLNLTLHAKNLDSTEEVTSQKSITASVLRREVTSIFIESLTIIMVSILLALWIGAGIYGYLLKRKIERPPSEREKEEEPKGKYVKPSDVSEKEEEKEKKKTDLDSLLEEEGI